MRFEGSRAKIRRAREHFDVLESKINAFLNPNPYRVAVDHTVPNLYVVRIDNEPPELPFEEWGLLIGDCVHNLRCALDYIAWQLAGSDPGDRMTLFPIFETVYGWNRPKSKSRRAKLPLCAISMMQAMQPYQAKNPPKTALNGLRLLDDADKHQLLTVAVPLQNTIRLILKRVPIDRLIVPTINYIDTPLHNGAIIAVARTPVGSPDVEMDAYFTPEIAFGKGLLPNERPRVLVSLRNIFTDVTNVVDDFERKFGTRYGAVPFYRNGQQITFPPSPTATIGP